MKRTILTLAGGAVGLVAALFGQARPVLAQSELPTGKTVTISGIPGCDCNTSSKDCYCRFS